METAPNVARLVLFWAAAPKKSMTYASTYGEISSPPSSPSPASPPTLSLPENQIPTIRLKSKPWGPNPILEIPIPVSRPKSLPQGPNTNLDAQLPAPMCLSIGNLSFWGHCPCHLIPSCTNLGASGTADHLTLLRISNFLLPFSPSDPVGQSVGFSVKFTPLW